MQVNMYCSYRVMINTNRGSGGKFMLLLILLLVIIIICCIVFRQNKKILNNQETIMLELNKLLVAIKQRNE